VRVSRAAKDLLERHLRSPGIEKGRVVERAIRHHIRALHQLPADTIQHPLLVVTRASGAAILKLNAARPTEPLRALMRDRE